MTVGKYSANMDSLRGVSTTIEQKATEEGRSARRAGRRPPRSAVGGPRRAGAPSGRTGAGQSHATATARSVADTQGRARRQRSGSVVAAVRGGGYRAAAAGRGNHGRSSGPRKGAEGACYTLAGADVLPMCSHSPPHRFGLGSRG